MGRVFDYLDVDGVRIRTLFDTGSRRTYIAAGAARTAGLEVRELRTRFSVGLGGEARTIGRYCHIECKVHSFDIDFMAYLIDSLGTDEHGNEIDAIFGATDMQNWSIGVDVQSESLDLTHFTRDFTEY